MNIKYSGENTSKALIKKFFEFLAKKVSTVNGVKPDADGNVTLTAENVGAKPSSYKAPVDSVNGKTGAVTLTASDVSARPSEWMPTASDVGALPASNPAADSEKLGGKAPEYYVQPVNLLDNSDFRNPVNQRGQTSYSTTVSSTVYTVDRWKHNGKMTAAITDEGLQLINDAEEGRRAFNQTLEDKRLIGKPITFAVCLSDESIHLVSGSFGTTEDSYTTRQFFLGDNYLALYNDAGFPSVRVAIAASTTLTLKWACLYEGTYTAETLPPYVPKGYTTELLECQRYFIAFPTYSSYAMPFAHGAATGETTARVELTLPVPMRINTPSVAAEGVTWYLRSVGKSVAATVSVLRAIGNKLVLTATVSSGLTTYEQTTLAYYGQSGKTLYICFSADL